MLTSLNSNYPITLCINLQYDNQRRQLVHKYLLRYYYMQNTWTGTMGDGKLSTTWSCLENLTVQWGSQNRRSRKHEPR